MPKPVARAQLGVATICPRRAYSSSRAKVNTTLIHGTEELTLCLMKWGVILSRSVLMELVGDESALVRPSE